VLRALASKEKQISAHDGRWFTVRIMPYHTIDDRIDGVVITFADITTAKTLEAKLRGKHTGLEKRVAEQSAKLDKAKKRSQTDRQARNRIKRRGGQSPGIDKT
jgi:hypothetical protein